MWKKILALSAIALILLAAFASIVINSLKVVNASDGVFTGNIYDYGQDTDMDGLFNFLVVEVEVSISEPGYYNVQINSLTDMYGSNLYILGLNETYLDVGMWNVSLSFNGIAIYGSKLNLTKVTQITIIHEYSSYNYFGDRFLHTTYNYTLFDTGALLTGKIYDEGIDTDSDGLFNYLQIGVEINVTDAALYQVTVSELVNVSGYYYDYIPTFNQTEEYLLPGDAQILNVSLHGATIYPSYATNISMVGWISLHIFENYNTYYIDSEGNLPLGRSYSYEEFETPAYLTGTITDEGIDSNSDGLYDYLTVGIEINVTEAGRYEVYIAGLIEQVNSTYSKYLYVSQWAENDFGNGLHTVYLNYSGPRLAYEHFSPTNLTSVSLTQSIYPYLQLGFIPSAPLSTKYNYTLFNAPSTDMQVDLTVYPNGTVGVGGTANITNMYPPNTGLQMNTTMSISTDGGTTIGAVNGTIVFPEDMFEWPFNSSTATFDAKYENGLLNASLGATLFMPPEGATTYPTNTSDFTLNSKYSNGLLDIDLSGTTEVPSFETMFPLNLSDFTIIADYMGKELKGNITFHAFPGFPIGDVVVHFNGNESNLYLTGHINMTYGNFFDIIDINSTVLDEMLANFTRDMPGPTGLVYNMTNGLLECTQWETTKTPWYDGLEEAGADVEYNVTINGNFTGFFAKTLTQMFFGGSPDQEQFVFAALDSAFYSVENGSILLNYYHTSGIGSANLHLTCDVEALWSKALELVPQTVPDEARTQVTAWLKIANATAYAIQDFSLNASYSETEQKLDLDAWLLANATQLKNDIIPIMPDAVPPSLHDVIESYLNTTYCEMTSYNATFNYVNGTANFEINWILQGDFKAQTNHTKRFYIDYLNATSPMMLNWQIRMLNETEIDINNFSAEYNMGKDWMYVAFNGLIIQPPKDDLDSIRFKLYRFFNMTSDDPQEPPRDFEKLKITVISGFNGTHTILLYASDTMPAPDTTSFDYKSMTWQNVTLSSMKDLNFHIAYQWIVNYLGTDYYVPVFTNSTASNFSFNLGTKSISFNVTGTSGAGFSEITIPRTLLYAAPAEWVVKIDGTPLSSGNFSVTENAQYVFIHMNYSHSEHLIEIIGTSVVTEFPPEILPLVLAILSIIVVVIAVKQRKKLGTVKTKYQSAIHTFANKLHQLRT